MQKFTPIDLLKRRIEVAKEDSDTSLFLHLMYAAEQLTKLVTVGILACVEDDNLRHRYSQEYRLVRADGIGEWTSTLDEILLGPTSHFLCLGIINFQRDLLDGKKPGSWQYDSIKLLNDCLQIVDKRAESLPTKTQGRNWFTLFARFRNKTRGHGAMGSNVCALICPLLEESINSIINNLEIFNFPWVYLKRNLNGNGSILTYNAPLWLHVGI